MANGATSLLTHLSIKEYDYIMAVGRTLKAMGENARLLTVFHEVFK